MLTVTLFNFSKRENSTKQPTGGVDVGCYLKEQTSVYTPSFEIYNINMPIYNYLKWENRYYYINDCTSIGNGQWLVECDIDVLATYKSDISNVTCFKKYATNGYDTSIPDTRLSTVDNATRKTNGVKIYDKATTFLITYVTSEPTRGGTGIVNVNASTALAIAKEITNTDLISSLVELQKSLQSAYDSVISCIQLPFSVSSGVTWPVYLGNYMTGITGAIPEYYIETTTNIEIPWQFTDWRNLNTYTSLIIYLPGYGSLELNPNDFIGKTTITITLGISGLDGTGAYLIDNIVKVPVNFGVFMPMNTVAKNPLALLSGGASALGSLASGNIIGATESLFNTSLASNTRYVGTGGGFSGGSGYINPTGYEYNYATLTSICHNTSIEPSAIGTVQGRPCNNVARISSGYNECVNASVSCIASQVIIDRINAYMNGGFYYE